MNTKRMADVLKWNIVSTKKNILRNMISMIIVFFTITLMCNGEEWYQTMVNPNYSVSEFVMVQQMKKSAGMCAVGSIIAIVLCAALTAFNIKTKTDYTNYMMLPATKLEKYISNVIYWTVLPIINIIVAILAADVIQIVISLIATGDFFSLSKRFFALFTTELPFREYYISVYALTLLILLHAIFCFGGIFFRKHQPLFTALTCVAIPLLAFVITGIVGSWAGDMLYNHGYEVVVTTYDIDISEETTINLLSLVVLLLAALVQWRAYRKFCNIQIINNRFFN